MKNKLLATVAIAAVVGFGGFASAQSQMGGESNKSTSGATSGTQERTGGSMSGTQSGSKTLSPSSTQSSTPSRNESAQEKSGKTNEQLGQGSKEESRESPTAQSHERENKGMNAQQDRGLQKNQKGAQDQRRERGNLQGAQKERGERDNVRGAQKERGTTERNATEQHGRTNERNATEQNGRSNVNVGERGERGGSVQLSEDQRSEIKTIIGREHGPRLGRSVNFDVRVGTRIPRSVHYAVLPSDIVRIVPQYRGFDYFLVEDEIVIVDPHTLEIVAIIPA
jgi:Protein of unknown function (DUF1236)